MSFINFTLGVVSLALTTPIYAQQSGSDEKEITDSRYETCDGQDSHCVKNIEVIEVKGFQNPV